MSTKIYFKQWRGRDAAPVKGLVFVADIGTFKPKAVRRCLFVVLMLTDSDLLGGKGSAQSELSPTLR